MIDQFIITLVTFASLILGICSTIYGFAKAAKVSRKEELKEAQENALKLMQIQTSISNIENTVRKIEEEQIVQHVKDEQIQEELRSEMKEVHKRLGTLEIIVKNHTAGFKRIHERIDKQGDVK